MKDSDIIELIKMEGTLTRGLIRSEIDRIEEMDQKRNGSIKENKELIKKIEKETIWVRWINKNPKKTIIIFFILLIGGVALANAINVHRTAERILNIELKDKTENTQ